MPLLPLILCCTASLLLISGPALAAPMDLRDLQARWVAVEFEVSPSSRPYQLRTIFTGQVRAWFEPLPQSGQVRVTIRGDAVERQVLPEQKPKAGSFSDFVWVFDIETGHVVSATLSGTLWRTLDWGIVRREVETRITADMTSIGVAGFKPPLRLLGNVYHRFCDDSESSRCTLIEGQGYDFESGYVNAVGKMKVGSKVAVVGAFSPLGEAVFSEIDELEPAHARAEYEQLDSPTLVPDTAGHAIDVAAPPPQIN